MEFRNSILFWFNKGLEGTRPLCPLNNQMHKYMQHSQAILNIESEKRST